MGRVAGGWRGGMLVLVLGACQPNQNGCNVNIAPLATFEFHDTGGGPDTVIATGIATAGTEWAWRSVDMCEPNADPNNIVCDVLATTTPIEDEYLKFNPVVSSQEMMVFAREPGEQHAFLQSQWDQTQPGVEPGKCFLFSEILPDYTTANEAVPEVLVVPQQSNLNNPNPASVTTSLEGHQFWPDGGSPSPQALPPQTRTLKAAWVQDHGQCSNPQPVQPILVRLGLGLWCGFQDSVAKAGAATYLVDQPIPQRTLLDTFSYLDRSSLVDTSGGHRHAELALHEESRNGSRPASGDRSGDWKLSPVPTRRIGHRVRLYGASQAPQRHSEYRRAGVVRRQGVEQPCLRPLRRGALFRSTRRPRVNAASGQQALFVAGRSTGVSKPVLGELRGNVNGLVPVGTQ